MALPPVSLCPQSRPTGLPLASLLQWQAPPACGCCQAPTPSPQTCASTQVSDIHWVCENSTQHTRLTRRGKVPWRTAVLAGPHAKDHRRRDECVEALADTGIVGKHSLTLTQASRAAQGSPVHHHKLELVAACRQLSIRRPLVALMPLHVRALLSIPGPQTLRAAY